ncbi:hypothetical protein [uncultured Bifidobacterium sp.]|uniref:hypothetical protein n=1 Tax=uncultured Bifidobacterium sp. TaxID=165187 RepID=UPI0027DC8032|nr:hypothetical protein [uncultured Bifidobacterium sp.]
MREELSTALSACGVVGFIVFGIATFGILETDNVDLPHIGLLALVMLADAALFAGSYLIGRDD